jgi:hypothetical protein
MEGGRVGVESGMLSYYFILIPALLYACPTAYANTP